MKKIYCESGALTKGIRKLGRKGCVELVHFPYDNPSSHTRKIPGIATPSNAQIQDLNLPIKDLPGVTADYSGSVHFDKILSIIGGPNNREDALHVDSAFKHGCSMFLTRDKDDILAHQKELRSLLGIKFLHPDEWRWRLQNRLICAWCLARAIADRLVRAACGPLTLYHF